MKTYKTFIINSSAVLKPSAWFRFNGGEFSQKDIPSEGTIKKTELTFSNGITEEDFESVFHEVTIYAKY